MAKVLQRHGEAKVCDSFILQCGAQPSGLQQGGKSEVIKAHHQRRSGVKVCNTFVLRCKRKTINHERNRERMEYKLEYVEVKDGKEILTPEDAVQYLDEFRSLPREILVVIHLTPTLRVQGFQKAAIGSSTSCAFETSDIFREAIVRDAKAILLAHNHPWQRGVLPTRDDIEVTQDLFEVGKKARMPLLDHIILGKDDYFSCKEKGRVFTKGPSYAVGTNPTTKTARRSALKMLALVSTGFILK